jgi:hypothetical protein
MRKAVCVLIDGDSLALNASKVVQVGHGFPRLTTLTISSLSIVTIAST